MTSFQNHKYINLTTFQKSGKEVPTPVWFVETNGMLYTFTGGQTGKAKRIRSNGKAQIAPSDARGKPLGEFLPAQSRIVQDTALIPPVNELYRKKYGLAYRLMNLMNRFRYSKTGESVLLESSFG